MNNLNKIGIVRKKEMLYFNHARILLLTAVSIRVFSNSISRFMFTSEA